MNLVEINLLPPEMRPKKRLVLPAMNFLPILLWIPLALFIIQLILISVVRYQKQQLNRFNNRWQELTSSNAKLAELKNEIQQVQSRAATVEDLLRRRFVWAKKLNQLSDALSQGIWLDQLYLDIKTQQIPPAVKGGQPKKILSYSLVLHGTAVSRKEEETAVIGRFMKDLKEDKEFFQDFQDIELGSIQADKFGTRDVMHFIITCYFKEGAVQ